MFNNDISNIKGIRITSANPNEQINVSFYIRKFIDSYHQSTLMALGSFYYFIWVIMCVQMRAHLCNIKMFDEKIISRYKKLDDLNRVIVNEFIDKIYVGEISDNIRNIKIKWNF